MSFTPLRCEMSFTPNRHETSYNSFQHILTDDDVKSCLRCVEHHLTEGGLFLISMSIPKTSLLHRGKNKLFAATDIFEYQNYKCQFMEENNYDEKKQINHIKWYLKRNDKIERVSYNFDFRLFFPHQIDIFLSECNLLIKKKSSDIYGTPINEKKEFRETRQHWIKMEQDRKQKKEWSRRHHPLADGLEMQISLCRKQTHPFEKH